jgi:hypothetical protein
VQLIVKCFYKKLMDQTYTTLIPVDTCSTTGRYYVLTPRGGGDGGAKMKKTNVMIMMID